MCMSLLAALIAALAPVGITIGESDIWWHLLNARNLLQYHSLSRIDTRTFTVAGSPWMSFEWLSEVPFFLAYRAAGLQGLLIFYSVLVILIFTGVYYRSCRDGANCKDAAVATLAGICIGSVSFYPRTILFGWICMTILLLMLDHFQRTGNGLWVLPPLFALWVNLHGTWLFGMIVLTIVIASGSVQGQWGLVQANRWDRTRFRKLLLTWLASVAALFLNPFGYKLVLYPFDFIFRQQGVVQGAQYWRSVDFSTLIGKLALGLIFAVLTAALFSRRPWQLYEVLLTGFALSLALSHMRFLDLAAIIIVPILAPRLKLLPPYQPELDKPWLNAIIMLALAMCLYYSFPTENDLEHKIADEYPQAALEFMQGQKLNGRIFNSVEFGGYMEWNAPALKPFIDGRGDIFIYNGIFDDYVSAVTVSKPLEIFDKYHIDYVLLEQKWPLTYVLEHSPGWRLIYRDKIAALFERVHQHSSTP